MKKKLSQTILVAILLFLSLTSLAQRNFAEETSFFTDLVYDKDNHILTGKTAPNANISLADIVATIVADDNGNFSVPIPDELKQTTITIMDVLNNQSTDINYNFVTASTATEESLAHSESSSLLQSTSQSLETTSSQAAVKTPTETKKDNSVLIWVVVLVVIIILTILVIFLVSKRQTEKKVSAEAALKTGQRSGKRKKRRKKTPD